MQRGKERELVFVGGQFQEAIALYYHRSPGGAKQFPKRLDALLKDARIPTVERYLRNVYRDPVTGTDKWGLVPAPDGGIMGVYSLSTETPVCTAGFDSAEPGKAATCQDWKFIVRPKRSHCIFESGQCLGITCWHGQDERLHSAASQRGDAFENVSHL